MTKPRVLLADDHALVREGMRNILEPDYEIVGEATDGRELVRIATELRPDVIVTDIAMPNLNGLEAIRQLQLENLSAKIVFLTMHVGVDFAVQALRLGASGYLLKSTPPRSSLGQSRRRWRGGSTSPPASPKT